MEQNQAQKNKQIKVTIVLLAILVIGLVGVTYAFFNYTRTGSANTIKVGNMSFESTNGTAINLTNVFPIDKNDVGTDTDNVGSVTINVKGSTDYNEGIEYLISSTGVTNTVNSGINSSMIPISIDVDYSANGNGKTIGTENNNYFNEGVRGGNTSYYKVLANQLLRNDEKLVVGYIAPGETGIDGNVTITAFLDKDRIGISDTYPEEHINLLNPDITEDQVAECVRLTTEWSLGNYLSDGETLDAFCRGTGTLSGTNLQYGLDHGFFVDSAVETFLNEGIIISYDNGTTTEWRNGRTIISTEDWNSLQETGISFKVKVEANEGTWVEEPGKIASCPNCKFLYAKNITMYATWNNHNITPTVVNQELDDTYLDIVENKGKDYFLGLILNDDKQIVRAYACGMKDDTPYCIEGSSDASTVESNIALLQSEELWNNACREYRYNDNQGQYAFTSTECYLGNLYSTMPVVHDHGCVEVSQPAISAKYRAGRGCYAYDEGAVGCYDNY